MFRPKNLGIGRVLALSDEDKKEIIGHHSEGDPHLASGLGNVMPQDLKLIREQGHCSQESPRDSSSQSSSLSSLDSDSGTETESSETSSEEHDETNEPSKKRIKIGDECESQALSSSQSNAAKACGTVICLVVESGMKRPDSQESRIVEGTAEQRTKPTKNKQKDAVSEGLSSLGRSHACLSDDPADTDSDDESNSQRIGPQLEAKDRKYSKSPEPVKLSPFLVHNNDDSVKHIQTCVRTNQESDQANIAARGLKLISRSLCTFLSSRKVAAQTDITAHIAKCMNLSDDQKSVKRRVYDFVNVLLSLGIVERQDEKHLRWVGVHVVHRISKRPRGRRGALAKADQGQTSRMAPAKGSQINEHCELDSSCVKPRQELSPLQKSANDGGQNSGKTVNPDNHMIQYDTAATKSQDSQSNQCSAKTNRPSDAGERRSKSDANDSGIGADETNQECILLESAVQSYRQKIKEKRRRMRKLTALCQSIQFIQKEQTKADHTDQKEPSSSKDDPTLSLPFAIVKLLKDTRDPIQVSTNAERDTMILHLQAGFEFASEAAVVKTLTKIKKNSLQPVTFIKSDSRRGRNPGTQNLTQ